MTKVYNDNYLVLGDFEATEQFVLLNNLDIDDIEVLSMIPKTYGIKWSTFKTIQETILKNDFLYWFYVDHLSSREYFIRYSFTKTPQSDYYMVVTPELLIRFREDIGNHVEALGDKLVLSMDKIRWMKRKNLN